MDTAVEEAPCGVKRRGTDVFTPFRGLGDRARGGDRARFEVPTWHPPKQPNRNEGTTGALPGSFEQKLPTNRPRAPYGALGRVLTSTDRTSGVF